MCKIEIMVFRKITKQKTEKCADYYLKFKQYIVKVIKCIAK